MLFSMQILGRLAPLARRFAPGIAGAWWRYRSENLRASAPPLRQQRNFD
jgi:hypothetical protein